MAVDTGHYPYKYDDAIAAGVPVDVATVCRDVVDAQHGYYEDPTVESYAVYKAALEAAEVVKAKVREGREGVGVVATDGDGTVVPPVGSGN